MNSTRQHNSTIPTLYSHFSEPSVRKDIIRIFNYRQFNTAIKESNFTPTPEEIFQICTRQVLSTSLVAKMSECTRSGCSAEDILIHVYALKQAGYMVSFIRPSIHVAYRDMMLVVSGKSRVDIRYTIHTRTAGNVKVALIKRITEVSKELHDLAADTWPINNRILSEYFLHIGAIISKETK